MRRAARIAVVLLAFALGSLATVSAQGAPWRLVQAADGTLYVVGDGVRHRIVPAPISDDELLAISEADAWDSGVMASATTAPAAPAPPPPSGDQARRVGETTVLTAPSGLRLALTVSSVTDPAQSTNQFNQPQGRWVLVDWTIKNEGSVDFDPFRNSFKLQTVDGFLVDPGNHVGHRGPDLDRGKLAPGQMARGFLVYDVPAGQRLKAAIFQPLGGRQFVAADLT